MSLLVKILSYALQSEQTLGIDWPKMDMVNESANDLMIAAFADFRSKTVHYFVAFSPTNSDAPLSILTNPWISESYLLDIGVELYDAGPGSVCMIRAFQKEWYEMGLRKRGIALPWPRKKHCYHCKIKKSKSVGLRLCKCCQAVRYCGRRCQKISWNKQHRYECGRNVRDFRL